MKKKNLFLSALLAGAMFMGNAQVAKAQQFHLANNPDFVAYSFASTPTVQNTGTHQIDVAGKQFKIMCYDGAEPGFSWEYNGTTGSAAINPTSITDPDIVLYYNGTTTYAFVTFIQNGLVRYNRYTYDPVNNFFNGAAPRTISSAAHSACSNPNIDITATGEAVIVYESNQNIYARTFDGSTATWPPSSVIHEVIDDPLNEFYGYHPDVAINKKGTNLTVSFAYVLSSTIYKSKEVAVMQMPYTTVASSAAPSGNWPVSVALNWSDVAAYPRIAAPHNSNYFDDYDFVAVFQNNKDIWSLGTSDNLNTFNAQVIANSSSLNSALNEKPVVTYAGDAAIAAWTFHDQGSIGSNNQEILAKKLWWNSTPMSADFSVVNVDPNGNQYAPALSGNYYQGEAFYMFIDDNQQSVLYKDSHYSNNNLRTANPNNTSQANLVDKLLKVYPNPMTTQSQLEVNLPEAEKVRSLAMYNLAGQQVATFETNNLKSGMNRLNLNNEQTKKLPKGMYLLRLITDTAQQTIKIQK